MNAAPAEIVDDGRGERVNLDGRSSERLSRRYVVATVWLLVIVATALRLHRIGSQPLWVDEAESSLNALTIVAHGVPVDHFLGQPLFENTLVRPWPESQEYEFRDLSYSDRGLAVYHSWLPLYSIAAAFRLAGVTSEAARQGTPIRDASQPEIEFWTTVPRLPAVAFGALAVVAAWGLGRRIQGQATGLGLAATVALSDFFVGVGRQARYYSATVAGTTLCALAIWNAWLRGRLVDHALAGLAVGVLFHIHSLSAVAMSGLYIVSCPLGRHQARLWLRVLTAGTVGTVVVLPWAAWSGLLSQVSLQPAARDYLTPEMVLLALPGNPLVWVVLGVGLAWAAAASWPGSRLREEWRRPVVDHFPALYFALSWVALSSLCFLAFIPAASFFRERLVLMTALPLMLALSLILVALSRATRPTAPFLPVAGLTTILILWGELPPRLPGPATGEFTSFIGVVRDWSLGTGGRLYASPNDHLVLTYYSGQPVQSIAPVRREWLDRFDDDLIVIEGGKYHVPAPHMVETIARRHGRTMTEAESQRRAREAVILATALDLEASGVAVEPFPRALDALDQTLVDLVRQSTRTAVQGLLQGTPIGQDTTLSNWEDFRFAFFYRFSDPHRRKGPELNYRACRATGRATVLPNNTTVIDCRRLREPPLVPEPIHPAMP